MTEQLVNPKHNKLKRVLALGLATASLTVLGEGVGAATAAPIRSGAKVERVTGIENSQNPLDIARIVIDKINNPTDKTYHHGVYEGAILLKKGTVIYSGPVVPIGGSKKPISGSRRLKSNEEILTVLPRVVDIRGRDFIIGYRNDGSGCLSAVNVENMMWIDKNTANYETLGLPDANNPRRAIRPKILPDQMNNDGNLVITEKINTLPLVVPPVLGSVSVFDSISEATSNINYLGLINLHHQYKPSV